MKADMNGAAVRMQGYVARLGFGMTRIKNQMVEARPISIKKNIDFFRFLRSCLFSIMLVKFLYGQVYMLAYDTLSAIG
jgi:hypothetical protein